MSEIYENATSVVVFLGANDETPCSELYDFFESLALAEEHDVDWVLRKTNVPVVTDQLYMMLQQPWWSRVWVVQELAYARRDPFIVYGGRQTDARTFWRGMDLLQERLMAKASAHRRRNLHDQSRPQTERLINNMHMLQMRYDLLSFRTRLHSAMYDISELLRVTRAHRAMDPRDHIFALNSLMREPFRTALAPDYNMTRREAYTRIATCLLTIQPWSDMYRFFPVGKHPQLPSWVPDFSRGLGVDVHSDYDRLWRWAPQMSVTGQLDCWIGAGLLHARGIDCGVVCTAYTIDEKDCDWAVPKIAEPTDTNEKLYVALASTVWDPNQPPFITQEDIAELCRKMSRESRQQLFAIFMLKAMSQPLQDSGQHVLDQIENAVWKIRQERRRRANVEDQQRVARLKQKSGSGRWAREQIAEDLQADDLEGTRSVAQMGKTARELDRQAKALEGGDRVSAAQLLKTAARLGFSIFSNDTGLAGVAPPSVREGDKVVMLHGLSALFIARETIDGPGQFVIVGRAIPFRDAAGEIRKGVENGWFVEKMMCFC